MYTPLKITTDYSLLQSLIKIDDLMLFLTENNISSCAMVDDNLAGSIDFYLQCQKNQIKPIIGLKVILNEEIIYLYAQNYQGYKNLIKIQSIILTRPLAVIDLKKYRANLLVIVPFKSKNIWSTLSFMPGLYLGYSNDLEKKNSKLMTDKTIFVNDIRALKAEDVKYLNYLDLLAEREKQDYSFNYYLTNNPTVEVNEIAAFVDQINLEIPFQERYIPRYQTDVDPNIFLKNLAQKGLNKRLKGQISPAYQQRLDYELDVITKMAFSDYFLIVYDYVLYAKKNNILVGPGRGSAAGSLVSYCLGITDIDPLKYQLIFERFLNPERITMPDIDIDFDATKREEVINYVKNKYGIDKVAGGLTFSTYKAKLIIRDLARILKINPLLLDKFIKNIKANLTLKENSEENSVKAYLARYPELKQLYDIALHLENLKKNISTHAAGIVISSVPLDEVIPIMVNGEEIITGIEMPYLENMGLLKMDFLGLKNLSFMAAVMEQAHIKNLNNLNLNDPKVFRIFNCLDVDGIFQFETPMMRRFLTKFKITTFNDLVAALALVRPGPKDHIDTFIARKEGRAKVNYIHPDLAPILQDTYGIILYQEQIISILTKIGGYSLGEADIIRRAISKKKAEVLKNEETHFIDRAVKNGYSTPIAKQIYNDIVTFASYGFNKSHSVAYALVSYEQAYLKAYYPREFILTQIKDHNGAMILPYLNKLKNLNCQIIKPSLLNTNADYIIEGSNIIMPLRSINGISGEINQKISQAGILKSDDYFTILLKMKDFLTPELATILIKAGALDFLGLNQATMLFNLDNAFNYLALVGDDSNLIAKPALVEQKELDSKVQRMAEWESFGFYISNHPASKYQAPDLVKLEKKAQYLFKKVKFIVLVEKIQKIKTKKGDDMAFFVASDETGSSDFTVFPANFSLLKDVAVNDLILVFGEVVKRFDKYQIIVNNIKKEGGHHE